MARSFVISIAAALAVVPVAARASPSLDEARELIADGRYAAAEDVARTVLAQTEARYGPNSLATAEVLDVLVEALWNGNVKLTSDETLDLARRAVQIKEQALGTEDSSLAWSLHRLGRVAHFRTLGQPLAMQEEAIAASQRALAIQEKVLGPNHPDVVKTLQDLGLMFIQTDQSNRRGLPLLERSLTIAEASFGPDHPLVARSLLHLGEAFRHQQAARAKELLERALAIHRKRLRPNHPQTAIILRRLASAHMNTGNNETARSLLHEALDIWSATLGPGHVGVEVGWCLSFLSSIENLRADFDTAASLGRESISAFEQTLGPYHGITVRHKAGLLNQCVCNYDYAPAETLCTQLVLATERPNSYFIGWLLPDTVTFLRGYLNWVKGQYAEAKHLWEEVMATVEHAYGADLQGTSSPGAIQPFVYYGALLGTMGDHAAAKQHLERAIAIGERMWEREKTMPDGQLAMAIEKLAGAHLARGDPARALACARRATHLLGGQRFEESMDGGFLTLGRAMAAEGRPDSARWCYERALALVEEHAGVESPAIAGPATALGIALAAAGDHEGAKHRLERAVAALEPLGPTPALSRALVELARFEWIAGNEGQALAHALRAEDMGRENLRLTARGVNEALAGRLSASRTSGLDLLLTMAARGQAATGTQAWDAMVRSRAVVLDEMAARHREAFEAEDAQVIRLRAAYVSASEQLATLLVRGAGVAQPLEPTDASGDRYRHRLGLARQAAETAEEELARSSAGFRRERVLEQLRLDDVATSVPQAAALVAYARYDEEPGRGEGSDAAVPSYLAFVLGSGTSEPEVLPLGAAIEIDNLVRAWSEAVAGDEDACRAAGVRLREKTWDPIAAHIGEAERIFIVPDGALNLVNFAALPASDDRYLVETSPLFHYLSAERDLVPQEGAGPPGEGLLAVGGPAFDATAAEPAVAALFRGERSACRDLASLRFEPLPGTAQETKEVASFWKKDTAQDAVLLRGARATETAVKQSAPGKRVVHLATHGFFLGGRCASALGGRRGIGGVATASYPDPLPPVAGENPLLLSGLAFAGANRRAEASAENDDGILTAQEIATLDLRGVEWAVLSACDTGAGEVRAGEGVFGLRRAFQVAGARTLVMSLWPVEDEAARGWMKALYEARFIRRLSTAAAVREASLARLRALRAAGASTHPSSWAAFVAAGDWR